MMSLEIDGLEYHPIPDSWIKAGADDRDGAGPQLLAISAATWRGSLKVRYAHPEHTRVGQIIEPATAAGDGLVPERLTRRQWPRSIPASRLEPVGEIRIEEIDWLHELWGDRDHDIHHRRLVADGGTLISSTDLDLIEDRQDQQRGKVGDLPNSRPDGTGVYRCPECQSQITRSPNGTEYGHKRGTSGKTERCPRRPESVDPTGKPGCDR